MVHTIPRLSPAYDYTTGGEFMAPPIPYGHYAKDYVGDAHKRAAGIKGHFAGLARRSRLITAMAMAMAAKMARLRIRPRPLRPPRRLRLRRARAASAE